MAAPKGNSFWKVRSKHGRDKIFKTPEALEVAISEYFQWCDDNPLYSTDFRGRDANEVDIPLRRVYQIHGLCNYLKCNVGYLNDFEDSLKGKKDKLSKGFSVVITWAKEVIYAQKFEGAAVGQFKESIISRDLGLAEKRELEHSGSIQWNEERTYEGDPVKPKKPAVKKKSIKKK